MLSKKTGPEPRATGKRNKVLYLGCFNLAHEVIIKRVYAVTERQAKALMIRRIAKEKGLIGMGGLPKVFDGHLDNFKIEEEKKDG